MKSNPMSPHHLRCRANSQSPARAIPDVLSCFKVVALIVTVMGISGCATSKPAASNIAVPIAAGELRLSASVRVQATPPSNTADKVPGQGVAGSIPFSPPPEYFESKLIARSVGTSLQGSALFSQVYDPSLTNDQPDFVLDVAFGHMYVGMVFMGEGVTVDFPSTWRLLTGNGGQVVANQTVQAHGAANSLSAKAASQKAFERALQDGITKGVSSLSQKISSKIMEGNSLELLSCAPPTPGSKQSILRLLATNTNRASLQWAVDKATDPEIKAAATLRLGKVVSASSSSSLLP